MFRYAVVTCADMRMMPAAICALLSVFQKNSRPDTKYILIGIDLQQSAHDDIRRFNEANGIDIEIVTYSEPSDLAATSGRWPPATLARLFIDLLLPDFFGAKFAVCGVLGVIAIQRSQFSTFTRSIHWLSFL